MTLESIFVLIVVLPILIFFLVVTVIVCLVIMRLIIAWPTVFERRQIEILMTFGHWIGLGWLRLDGHRLLKTVYS